MRRCAWPIAWPTPGRCGMIWIVILLVCILLELWQINGKLPKPPEEYDGRHGPLN